MTQPQIPQTRVVKNGNGTGSNPEATPTPSMKDFNDPPWAFRYEGPPGGLGPALIKSGSLSEAVPRGVLALFEEEIKANAARASEVCITCSASENPREKDQNGSGPKPILRELLISVAFR